MLLRDYIDYLTTCAYGCAGDVRSQDGVVFDDDQQASFDAIIEFATGHKLCVVILVERGDEGRARPYWYKFHFQDRSGALVERWDYDPQKNPDYHRHKPPHASRKILDHPREFDDVLEMIWDDYLGPELSSSPA